MAQPVQASAPSAVTGPAYAGSGARLIAYLIDGVITSIGMAVLTVVLANVIGAAGTAGREVIVGLLIIIWFLAFLVIWLLYFPYFWARDGQTPGRRSCTSA